MAVVIIVILFLFSIFGSIYFYGGKIRKRKILIPKRRVASKTPALTTLYTGDIELGKPPVRSQEMFKNKLYLINTDNSEFWEKLMKNEDVILVDCRNKLEYLGGHIKPVNEMSINISCTEDLEKLAHVSEFQGQKTYIPRHVNKILLFYCEFGKTRSVNIASWYFRNVSQKDIYVLNDGYMHIADISSHRTMSRQIKIHANYLEPCDSRLIKYVGKISQIYADMALPGNKPKNVGRSHRGEVIYIPESISKDLFFLYKGEMEKDGIILYEGIKRKGKDIIALDHKVLLSNFPEIQ